MADNQARRDPNRVPSLIGVDNISFEDTQTVAVNADHELLVAGTFTSSGGAISDGVASTLKATVVNYANSNPLTVRLTDTNGDYVGAGGGTQYTEDAVAAANPTGTGVNLIRQDTPATLVTTDGDNVGQRGTNYGAAYTQVVTSAGAFVDTFGGGTEYTEDAVAAVNPAGNALIVVREDARAGALTSADGDNVALRGNNAGELYVKHTDSVAVTGTITANIGTVATLATAAKQDTQDTSINTLLKPASTLSAVTTVSTVTNLSQMGGAAISLNTGVRDAGTQRVTIATNDSVPVTGTVTANAGTNLNTSALALEAGGNLASIKAKTDNIPAQGQALAAASTPVVLTAAQITTLTPPAAITGFATSALQSTQDTSINTLLKPASTLTAVTTVTTVGAVTAITNALPAGANAIGKLAANSGVDIGDVDVLTVNGVAPSFGTGTRAATVQRVTIATDDIVPASQSGTWTVQPGNTPNSTPWLTTDTPAASGGLTKFHLVGAATDNATNIKASAGQVYSITAFNLNASPRYLKFHNTAGVPTAGAGVTDTFLIPGNTSGAGLVLNIDKGIAFSTGIAITMVTGIADANATAIAASEVVINVYYK